MECAQEGHFHRPFKGVIILKGVSLIEIGLDAGEYLAFDVSTNGGATWVEKARLRGNVDPENTWHKVSVNLTNINSLRIQFRGKMSLPDEDADVDMVRVTAK